MSGTKKSRRKSKSPKVKLSLGKVYAFTVTVCVLCVLALLLSSLLQSRKKPSEQSELVYSEQKSEKIEKISTQPEKKEKHEIQPPVENHATSEKVKDERKISAKKDEKSYEKPHENEKIVLEEKKPLFVIPPAKPGSTIFLVIDDAGQSAARTKLYADLPFPLTIAVLPCLPHTKECAEVVLNGGKELILHQPMQAMNERLNPGDGAVLKEMTKDEIKDVVRANIRQLGSGIKGMNNHEGSLITADAEKIGAVLDVCIEEGIYFLDSRTTEKTQAVNAAFARGIKIFEKEGPYIDNEISREKMTERIYETLDYANRHGQAVVIGHVDKSANILPALLEEMYPYLKKAGYTFKTPSQIE